MIALLLTLQIAAQTPAASDALDFSAHLIDGSTVEGSLTGWQDGTLTLSTAGKFRYLAVEQIARLSRTSRRSVKAATDGNSHSQTYVGLRDGSTFNVRSFKLGQQAGNHATSTMVCRSSQVTLPNKHMQYVRFRDSSHALAQQWQELLDTQHDGDVIVIRRSAESLDYLEGIIRTITPKNVQFEFDGDTIDVDIRKLEGAIFFSRHGPISHKSPKMRLFFGDDDVLQAKHVHLESGVVDGEIAEGGVVEGRSLKIETECGATIPVHLADLRRIDFMTGRVTYLSDLKPTRVKITPTIGTRVSSKALSQLLYAPRRDESFSKTALTLAVPSEGLEQAYSKGMAIHSKTEVKFRLHREYQRLKAIVGLDPHRSHSGSVQLVIVLDGSTVVDQAIERSDDPVELDIDIFEADKLTILVDYGNDGDAGDRLHLCNLRLVK